MRRSDGFIPGIRPGPPTAEYLTYVRSRLTFAAALSFALLAALPTVTLALLGDDGLLLSGATMILIASSAYATTDATTRTLRAVAERTPPPPRRPTHVGYEAPTP